MLKKTVNKAKRCGPCTLKKTVNKAKRVSDSLAKRATAAKARAQKLAKKYQACK